MCTGIRIQLANGTYVFARTLEFANQLIWLQKCYPGYKGTFAQIPGNPDTFMVDGMNTSGLFSGAFFFPCHIEDNYEPSLPGDNPFTKWATTMVCNNIVTQYTSVQALKDAIDSNAFEITLGTVGPTPFSLHWLVGDATGDLIVVECVNKKVFYHDNHANVIANEPTFPEISAYNDTFYEDTENAKPLSKVTVPNSCYQGTGQGDPSGFGGSNMDRSLLPTKSMPGDPSSPSRFVRAGFYVKNLVPASGNNGLDMALRVLHNFDIPYGSIYENASPNAAIEVTEYTVAYHIGCYTMKYAPYGWKQDLSRPERDNWFQTDMPVTLCDNEFTDSAKSSVINTSTPQNQTLPPGTSVNIHLTGKDKNAGEIARIRQILRRKGLNRRRRRRLRRRLNMLRQSRVVYSVGSDPNVNIYTPSIY